MKKALFLHAEHKPTKSRNKKINIYFTSMKSQMIF